MPLHISKYERRDGVDRDDLAKAALTACRVARAEEGVRDARFYWIDWDRIAVMVNAEPGKWGPGNAEGPKPAVARASRELQDLARMVEHETWAEAGLGEQAYIASRQ